MIIKDENGPLERRSYGLGEVKVADVTGDGEMVFSGYGAVFGNVDSHGDVIAKGAFTDTINRAKSSGMWPAMLSQHGWSDAGETPVGVYTEMREDEVGLWVEGKLANTARGREIHELLKMKPRPALNGMSIGFRAKEWAVRTAPEEPRRTLKVVDLVEISLVTFPSNGKARIRNVKSEFNPRDMEDALRDAGLSGADSKTAVSVFKKSMLRDEADMTDDLRDEGEAAKKREEKAVISLAERIRALAK